MTEITLDLGGETSESVTVHAVWIEHNGERILTDIVLSVQRDELIVSVNDAVVCATMRGRKLIKA